MHARRVIPSDLIPPVALGQPWFLGSLAALLINDHYLKSVFPGVVTGKISDFAGPVVLAAVAAVIVGRRAAVALTVVGFVALKTVPGVAEVAAPVLGGITRRDPTDLIGLGAMPFLWRRLGDHAPAPRATAWVPRVRLVTTDHQTVGAWIRSRGLPIVGAALAMVALTATSPASRAAVETLSVSESTVYAALIPEGDLDEVSEWAASTDGGMTWEELDGEPPSDATAASAEGCTSDGRCFAARGGSIEETSPSGEARTSFELNGNQRDVLEYYLSGSTSVDPEMMFESVAIVPGTGRDSVVVSAQDQGVVVLRPNGGWERVAVLDVEPTPINGSTVPLDLASDFILFSMPIAFLAALVMVVSRSGATAGAKVGSFLGAMLIAGLFWGVGIGAWLFGTISNHNPIVLAGVLAALSLATIYFPLLFIRKAAFAPDPAQP